MNYKTYAEAKIANPDCEIVTTGKDWNGCSSFAGVFQKINDGGRCEIGNEYWVACNPADYCSSIKEFLEAGYIFSVGDFFIGIDGEVISVRDANSSSVPYDDDYKRYILSAAALNGGCKIPAKADQWTVYSNTMPLCKLTDEQYGKMRRMHDSGADVEFANVTNGFEFEVIDNPKWCKDQVYRIKSKSERELFIDKSKSIIGATTDEELVGAVIADLFDAGARYTDLTQYFGENI